MRLVGCSSLVTFSQVLRWGCLIISVPSSSGIDSHHGELCYAHSAFVCASEKVIV